MSLTIIDPGPLSLVQDHGRPGLGHLGVTSSGAFDRDALRVVNTLLGNEPGAGAIETLGGGLALRADATHTVAVAGAVGPATIDDRPLAHGRAVPIRAGQTLRIGQPTWGLRTYLGVAGALAVAPELGSRSTDTLAGLGPSPLQCGDVLPVGTPDRVPCLDDVPPLPRTGDLTLDVVLGPRDDWFTADAVRQLLETPWQVTPASDRIGVRLSGAVLERAQHRELPSEPCLRGSIQVAADGQPIVFGPDHPVTGGYPVIAVVADRHTDRLAQARPGDLVRFRRVLLR